MEKEKTIKCKFGEMTKEQLREAGRKGGLTRSENFKRRKALKETLNVLLEMPVRKGKITDCETVRSFAELKGKNLTVDQALMVVLMQKGLKGDLNAISMIRDTIGEKPSDKVEVKDVTPVILSGEDELME